MLKKYDEKHAENFLKGIKTLTGIPYKKLEKYAGMNNLFNILEHPNTIEPNPQQLEKISLLNEFIATYGLLKLQEEQNKITLNTSLKSGDYFASILGGIKDKEEFLVAFMDSGNNIIETRIVSEGSIGEAVVYPRDVLKAALDCDCKSMILSHNHPGGTMKPSTQDVDITEKLVSIFKPLEIHILDHVIVAGNGYYSMAEKGQMPSANINKASYQPVTLSAEAKEETQGFNNEALEEEEGWEL